MNPVMLAVSTFRWQLKTVNKAVKLAAECRRLVVVYVVDINLARYLIGSDAGLYSKLKGNCEADILREHEELARTRTALVVKRAKRAGVETVVHLQTGRFADVAVKFVREANPSMVVTTRSNRPPWVRYFFGSPVDRLEDEAGCAVVEA